jgi:hypothetical protein
MALLKEKDKVEKEELKMKAKIEKDQLKERNRLEEEEKRKSKDKGKALGSPLGTESGTAAEASAIDRPASSGGRVAADSAKRASTQPSESLKDSSDEEERPATGKSTEEDALASPTSPSKGQSKVKSWFAGRFRASSKAAKDDEDGDTSKTGFIGGASLTGASSSADGAENKPREGSMRDVAMAGKSPPPVHEIVTIPQSDPVSPINENLARNTGDNASISSLSESGEEASSGKKKKPHRGRLGFKDRLLRKTNTKSSNDTDNEEFEEARDTFEEEKLAPPPKLIAISVASKPSASPIRDSKFSENL